MASADDEPRDKAMRRYGRARGPSSPPSAGTPPRPRPRRSARNLGLPERVLAQPLGTLSGGQRRRVELARILFSGAETLLLDEPTNHLDADSIAWLRGYLAQHKGGLVVISHDVELLDAVGQPGAGTSTPTARRSTSYNMGWKTYLKQRETDERRRTPRAGQRGEEGRRPAWRRPTRCAPRPPRRRPRRTWPSAPSSCSAGLEDARSADKVAKLRFPEPGAVRQDAADAPTGCPSPTARWRSSPTSTWRSTAAPGSSSSGLNGAGKTTLLRMLAGVEHARHRRGACRATACGWATTPRSTRRSTSSRTVLENMRSAAADLDRAPSCATVLGSFLFTGDDVDKPAGVLSGGEKTRLALATLVVLRRQRAAARRADQQPRPGQPRGGPRRAARPTRARSCWSPTTRAPSQALEPERVLLLPDGVEDLWSDDYLDLVALA